MIGVRSRLVLRITDPRHPCLTVHPLRRIAFGGIAVLLIAAAIAGAREAPLSQHPLGSVLYLGITGTCVVIAALSRGYRFDLDQREVHYQLSLFGLRLAGSRFSLDEVHAVQVTGLRMVADRARPHPGALNAGFSGYVERRMRYYRLSLLLETGSVRLEDGTDGPELQHLGKTLAHVIGKSFFFEEN